MRMKVVEKKRSLKKNQRRRKKRVTSQYQELSLL
jgi:hypothetical protein